ncbi:MAG: hypothetical protein H7Z21_10460, partial [Hymenobacter sp.]|nr:hypothetical protein [Hymenobacter sp.]
MKNFPLLLLLLPAALFGGALPVAAQTASPLPNTRIKVYLLGTFHFNGSSGDVVKSGKTDMQSAKMQQQVGDLVDRLTKTKADKVFVEWRQSRQRYVDSTYALYRQNQFQLGNNEVFQLGYRLAA